MKEKPEEKKSRPKVEVEELREPESEKKELTPEKTEEPMPEELQVAETPIETEKPKKEELPASKRGYSAKTVILVALITALLVGALAGGIYVYWSGLARLETPPGETPSPTPMATPVPTSTPTASPAADLSEFKVSVLNGSGKIGEATKVKNLLTKAGFTVTSTANASSFDFGNTVIQAKKEVSETVVEAVKEALKGNYTVEVGETLVASSTYDIVVTVGSK